MCMDFKTSQISLVIVYVSMPILKVINSHGTYNLEEIQVVDQIKNHGTCIELKNPPCQLFDGEYNFGELHFPTLQ